MQQNPAILTHFIQSLVVPGYAHQVHPIQSVLAPVHLHAAAHRQELSSVFQPSGYHHRIPSAEHHPSVRCSLDWCLGQVVSHVAQYQTSNRCSTAVILPPSNLSILSFLTGLCFSPCKVWHNFCRFPKTFQKTLALPKKIGFPNGGKNKLR